MLPSYLKTSFSPKTPTCSNMYSYRGTYFAATFLTLSLILGTPSAAFGTTATFTSIGNIRVYLIIAISTRVNIIYKWVTKIAKDI